MLLGERKDLIVSCYRDNMGCLTMKKLKFSEELESLVDEEGYRYRGRRFCTVSERSIGHHSIKGAEKEAISDLEILAEKRGADAYEIISLHVEDSRQEYDSTPFSATATAILYKRK